MAAVAVSGETEAVPKKPKYQFDYYTPRPKYWSYDGLPFGGVYGAVLAVVVGLVVRRGELVFEHFLWCLLPVTLHVLLFLATQWSVKARCLVRFRAETDIGRATHVRVLPLVISTDKNYPTLLVPLERQGADLSIQYQKKRFVYSAETGSFARLRFDITAELGKYMESSGLSGRGVADATQRFGANMYDIPLPTFGELFQEHAVAPFFVFQVFCVLLWLMDDYWYYALLTLFMLIVLEAQMVQRRLHDLSELRAMRIPPRPVHAHRDGGWKVVLSDQLLPGDIVAICRAPEVSFPCDVLLMQGSVLANEAMLTGESVPQMKVAVSHAPGSEELRERLDMKGTHKQHIVSAGTNIMLHQNNVKAATNIKKVPIVGSSTAAIGYVLRTGFDTTQGKLCRTILFSAERVTVQSREAFHFILILLAFAVGACGYVLYDGLVLAALRPEEKPRSTFKLFLSVSHIITSVVPPEFPIMLSLAVNLSLVALVRKRIFCTEPFRVPLAGRIETCCFDKTGTLTSDSMQVGGVYGLTGGGAPSLEKTAVGEDTEGRENCRALDQSLPFLTTATMAACSGLTIVEGDVVGDPLERAALQAVGWIMTVPDVVVSKRLTKGADRLQVLHRFPFASELQRMAVVVRHTGPGAGHLDEGNSDPKRDHDRWLALVKGSCEALRPRLRQVPSDFDALQMKLTKAGFRVLCLAAKELPREGSRDPEQIPRSEVESDLEFCGVLALRNAIKSQVSVTIRKLRKSYHRVVMITGDNPQTACQVAIQVSMAEGKFLMLERVKGSEPSPNGGDVAQSAALLEWRFRDDPTKTPKPFNVDKIQDLTKKYTLCVPGFALALLPANDLLALAPHVTVWARVSPQQKEQVVTALNKDSHTIMVGDGTNDVGALKHAHVGISLLTSVPTIPGGRQQEMMDERAPIVRLGDASIASPFTYKGDSIKCALDIVRCGRATLSTVLMMYKIMGLNSVVSAFAMSVLTLDGVKLGDFQSTVESLFTSMLFFMVSRSNPANQLAKQRPRGSVFAWNVLLSLALQLVVHLTILCRGWMLANSFRASDWKRDLEADFEPNLTNTVVFQMLSAMHVSSFLANYEGAPFMQPLRTNRTLMLSLLWFAVLIFITAAEIAPDLNESLSLVPSPTHEFRGEILKLLAADICLSVGLAQTVQAVAVHLSGREAERRAREWNLGMDTKRGSSDKESSATKKNK